MCRKFVEEVFSMISVCVNYRVVAFSESFMMMMISNNENTGSATISIDSNGMNSIIVVPGAASGLTIEMVNQKSNLFKDISFFFKPQTSAHIYINPLIVTPLSPEQL